MFETGRQAPWSIGLRRVPQACSSSADIRAGVVYPELFKNCANSGASRDTQGSIRIQEPPPTPTWRDDARPQGGRRITCRRAGPLSMSKAFTRESDSDPDDRDDDGADALPAHAQNHAKNYVTPAGHAALQTEHRHLLQEERPKVVEVVTWAASNGDRSENADYHYGKKRLREIDRRVRYLTKRLESAVLVDPKEQQALRQVFFGA